jgi:hypothetical protein
MRNWQLAYAPCTRHHEDRTPTHGYEVTREAAMAVFAKSWRRRAARGGTARTISVDLSRVLINAQMEVRFRVQTGKHLFTLSLTAADHERLETWYNPSIA